VGIVNSNQLNLPLLPKLSSTPTKLSPQKEKSNIQATLGKRARERFTGANETRILAPAREKTDVLICGMREVLLSSHQSLNGTSLYPYQGTGSSRSTRSAGPLSYVLPLTPMDEREGREARGRCTHLARLKARD